MGLGVKWSTSALLGAAAGVGAAAAKAYARRQDRRTRPPASALGVDGLGEQEPLEVAPPTLTAPPVTPPPAAPTTATVNDDIAALDEARNRLRARADELAREMDGDHA